MAKKLVIRDDDTCYHTKPSELEDIFNELHRIGAKVTLSVIPETTGEFRTINLNSSKTNGKKKVWENTELVEYINRRKALNELDVTLHGFTHEYKLLKELTPELKWKDAGTVELELRDATKNFREYFGKELKSFVPPSNALSRDVAAVISKNGLHISGVIERSFNRRFNLRSALNYSTKILYKVLTGRTVPYVLNYGSNKELTFYNLTPSVNVDDLSEQLEFCARNNYPFVLCTHYWELRDNAHLKISLNELVKRALDLGYEPVFLDEVFL